MGSLVSPKGPKMDLYISSLRYEVVDIGVDFLTALMEFLSGLPVGLPVGSLILFLMARC